MQLYFGLLLNANLKGFVSGSIYKGSSKLLCTPGLNCYSCPGAISACPLGSLQGAFSAGHSTVYYVGGILLLYGILFGRLICGWLCPFGLIQEALYKIKTPKLRKNPITRVLSYGKYVLLFIFVVLIPIAYAFRDVPLPAFCKYICPAGTLEGGLILLSNAANASYLSMLGPLFTWKSLLTICILLGCLFIFRMFCRFICPLGAFYGLFNKLSFFGIEVKKDKCIDCGLCEAKCLMDVRRPGDTECISCGNCVDACPTKAIVWKGSRIFLKANEGQPQSKARFVARMVGGILAVAILVGAIGYSWVNSSAEVQIGSQVGDRCFSYDLSIMDSTGITANTMDPTKTGKLTIVNFWGTWCAPCIDELPYFDEIASKYPEDVQVIAVRTDMASDTAPNLIEKYYPNSKIVFAKDYNQNGAEGYYTALGGRDAYPYTVVLDNTGIILSKFVGPVTYQELQEIVKAKRT